MSWSCSLLSDADRLAFVRLGIFAGSFDLEAALAVAGDDSDEQWEIIDVLESLGSLKDAFRGGGPSAGSGSPPA